MRGVDLFPRADEGEWVRIFDRQVVQFQHEKLRRDGGRDFTINPITRAEYDTIFARITTDNDYQGWRDRRDEELRGERVFWKGVDPLNIDKLQEISSDRPRLQPFKMNYDTLDEVRMRFNKTVILVKGNPFAVTDQRQISEQFYLLLEDAQNKRSYSSLRDIPDFRPAAPGYVRLGESNGYLRRSPARVNQQGMTSNSVVIKKVGDTANLPFNNGGLVDALTTRGKLLKWEASYERLFNDRVVSTMRLSDTLAVYQKKAGGIVAEYKGRRLGDIKEGVVKLYDEDDIIQPWLKSDAKKVDLEIVA